MARLLHDWLAIQAYHDQGHGFVACSRRFGFTHTAWIKAIQRGKLRVAPSPFPDRRRRYNWSEIQRFYDEGNDMKACQKRFGFFNESWYKAVRRGDVKIRRIRAGILENRCSECGLSEWRGRALSVQIDHINGIRSDHRLENLRMLCPNCHSQTATFAARNRRPRPLQDPCRSV